MTWRTAFRAAFILGVLGSTVALLLFILGIFLNKYNHGLPGCLQQIYIIIWPFSIGLLGLDRATAIDLGSYVVLAFLISGNGMFYAVICFWICCVVKLVSFGKRVFARHKIGRA
jgi:hypothetical protein